MVSVSEVDRTLTEETKQECTKYGPVKQCSLYMVTERDTFTGVRCPEEERVRVFVVFESQESAVKAYRYVVGCRDDVYYGP